MNNNNKFYNNFCNITSKILNKYKNNIIKWLI